MAAQGRAQSFRAIRPVLERTRLRHAAPLRLLEEMGDDVAREQASPHANDELKNAVGGIRDIIHVPGAGGKSTSTT